MRNTKAFVLIASIGVLGCKQTPPDASTGAAGAASKVRPSQTVRPPKHEIVAPQMVQGTNKIVAPQMVQGTNKIVAPQMVQGTNKIVAPQMLIGEEGLRAKR